MLKINLKIATMLIPVLIGLAWPSLSRALPDHKVNRFLFVGLPNQDSLEDQRQIYYFLLKALGQKVEYRSAQQISNGIRGNTIAITDYDGVIWHHSSPDTDATGYLLTKEIMKHDMPTILFDGVDFALSRNLGLINPLSKPVSSRPIVVSWVAAAKIEGFGNEWHYLLQGRESGLLRAGKKDGGRATGLTLGDNARVNAIRWSGTTDKYTRRLHLAGESPLPKPYSFSEFQGYAGKNVTTFVNDRRKIVSTGLSYAAAYDSFAHDYETGEDLEYHASYWRFVHRMLLYVTRSSASGNAGGQNTFTETDLVVPSRGFDFEIKRTYNSANSNHNSILGPNWFSNHDVSIIWDKFNDKLTYQDGNGSTVEMFMVDGDGLDKPVTDELAGKRTFVSVNAKNTDIAVLEGDTIVMRNIRGREIHFERQRFTQQWWTHVPNFHSLGMIRGGELELYRIKEIRDSNGNRQTYSYRTDVSRYSGENCNERQSPWPMLDAVTDTEGRKYIFHTCYNQIVTKVNGYYPKLFGHQYNLEGIDAGNVHIDYIWTDEIGLGRNQLTQVESRGGMTRTYNYDLEPQETRGDLATNDDLFYRPLKEVIDENGDSIMRFRYEPVSRDSYISVRPLRPEGGEPGTFFPGRLIAKEVGAPDEAQVVERFYHRRTGIGDRNDLQKTHSVLTTLQNGQATSVALNARETPIITHEWNVAGIGSDYHAPGFTAVDPVDPNASLIAAKTLLGGILLPAYEPVGAEGNCNGSSLSDPAFNPLESCAGFTTYYQVNYDGMITAETSASGKSTFIWRLIDYIMADRANKKTARTMDSKMLDFWKEYWHLRTYLSNEITNMQLGMDQNHLLTTTVYEPIFNKPTAVYENNRTMPTRLFRYDYMRSVLPKSGWFGRFFNDEYGMNDASMKGLLGLPHADIQAWPPLLAGKGFEPFKAFDNIPWLDDYRGLCDPEGENKRTKHSGNMICEILPATQSYRGHNATVPARPRAARVFGYDPVGQLRFERSPEGRAVYTERCKVRDSHCNLNDFKIDGKDLPKGIFKAVKTISTGTTGQPGDGSNIEKITYYNSRGLKFRTVRPAHTIDGERYERYVTVADIYYDERDRIVGGQVSEIAGDQVSVISSKSIVNDPLGRPVIVEEDRCPGGPCQVGSAVGQTRRTLFAYDTRGHNVVKCSELSKDARGGTDQYTCQGKIFDASGRIARETEHGQCPFSSNLETPLQVQTALYYNVLFGHCAPKLTTQYQYNSRGLLSGVTRQPGTAEARENRTYYDQDASPVAVVDAEGGWTETAYDGLGRRVRKVTGATGYGAHGANSMSTGYEYGYHGRLIRQTQGAPTSGVGTSESYGVTEFEFDLRGARIGSKTWQRELESSSSVSQTIATYTILNQDGQKTKTIHVEGGYRSEDEVTYDDFGRVASSYSAATNQGQSLERDEKGQVIETTAWYLDDSGVPQEQRRTQTVHDGLGRVIERVNLSTNSDKRQTTLMYYDGLGHLLSSVDPKGQLTSFYRDGQGNAKRTFEHFNLTGSNPLPVLGYWDFDNIEDFLAYDAIVNEATFNNRGQVLSRTDALGNTTSFAYNAFGELVSTTRPDGSTKVVKLNKRGAVTQVTDWDGSVLKYHLDSLDRPLIVRNGRGGLVQLFGYLRDGKLSKVTDTNLYNPGVRQVTTSHRYDTLGNLLSETTAITDNSGDTTEATISAQYTGRRMERLIYPSDIDHKELDYLYDSQANGLIQKMGDDDGLLVTLQWYGSTLWKLTRNIDSRQTATTTRSFDGFWRLSRQSNTTDQGSVSNFAYYYNNNDRLLAERGARVPNPLTRPYVQNYELDDLDRVEGFEGPVADYDIALDKANNVNWLRDRNGGGPARQLIPSKNGLNQVSHVYQDGVNHPLTYDDNCNLVEDGGSLADHDREYEWDDLGRLVAVRNSDSNELIAAYAYDGLNRRVRKTISRDNRDEIVDFRLFGSDVVEEYHRLEDGTREWLLAILHNPTATDSYLRWDRYDRTRAGTWRLRKKQYPMSDVRNNVEAVLDGDGNVEPLRYDLHGNEIDTDHDQYIPYRFSGRRYDEETGLYYYRTRYYSSHIARFISLDTIGIWGDMNNYGNGYAYVGNMGNSAVDPTGTSEKMPGWAYGGFGGMSNTMYLSAYSPETGAMVSTAQAQQAAIGMTLLSIPATLGGASVFGVGLTLGSGAASLSLSQNKAEAAWTGGTTGLSLAAGLIPGGFGKALSIFFTGAGQVDLAGMIKDLKSKGDVDAALALSEANLMLLNYRLDELAADTQSLVTKFEEALAKGDLKGAKSLIEQLLEKEEEGKGLDAETQKILKLLDDLLAGLRPVPGSEGAGMGPGNIKDAINRALRGAGKGGSGGGLPYSGPTPSSDEPCFWKPFDPNKLRGGTESEKPRNDLPGSIGWIDEHGNIHIHGGGGGGSSDGIWDLISLLNSVPGGPHGGNIDPVPPFIHVGLGSVIPDGVSL